MKWTEAEVLALIQAGLAAGPLFKAAYDKIRGNSNGVRTLEELEADTKQMIADGTAEAQKEIQDNQ